MANTYSVNLNGTDQAFSATDHADFKPTGNFTVGFWLRTSGSASKVIMQSFAYGTSKYAGWYLGLSASNYVYFASGKNSGSTDGVDVKIITDTVSVADGVWHWIVATWDGSNLNLYRDGTAVTPVAWANAPVYQATNYVRIGCYNDTGSNSLFFTGNIDEAFVINGTAWDQTAVNAYYNTYITGANLKAYYQFENNGNDSSGNSHTLTDIGTPTYVNNTPFDSVSSPTVISGSDTGIISPGNSNTYSGSVTIPSSGQNRMFFIYGGHGAGGNLSSGTLGGQALTCVNSTVTATYSYFAYLVNPPTGSQTLVLNWDATGANRKLRGFTLQNVAQTSPVDQTSDKADFSGTSPQSKSITTTVDNELVVAMWNADSSATVIANSWGATDFWLDQYSTPIYSHAISYMPKATAGAIAGSYTYTGSAAGNLMVISIKYQAPSAVSSATTSSFHFM